MTKKRVQTWVRVAVAAPLLVGVAVMAFAAVTAAQAPAAEAGVAPETVGSAYLAAAIATGAACVGAGIAVAYVGAAAVAVVAEKPQMAGRTLIFVGLAEGIAIYGLIIAIMILGRV
ncbi:MAG: ATPase [Candidatus Hydrogenedentes bacterium]|nr:ATPase [Candidatus Hydrogenedentota bacterium]